ncbi:lectin [Phanerochaete sordida]|uniref:Lectin n=1 Tax=Phanerochaete sordida TaxID=48140 RepID=A0A9P3LJP9_9APHY|nr:lectin [Phanerochaete sordida]
MTYTIKVVLWSDVEGLELVESSVWHYANGGTWDLTHKGTDTSSPAYTLTMSGSGTSGMLRFKARSGELCAVAVGIHNYAPWSGVAVDLTPGETLQAVHKEFYAGGKRSSPTLKDANATSKTGFVVAVTYDQSSDNKAYEATVGITGP